MFAAPLPELVRRRHQATRKSSRSHLTVSITLWHNQERKEERLL